MLVFAPTQKTKTVRAEVADWKFSKAWTPIAFELRRKVIYWLIVACQFE